MLLEPCFLESDYFNQDDFVIVMVLTKRTMYVLPNLLASMVKIQVFVVALIKDRDRVMYVLPNLLDILYYSLVISFFICVYRILECCMLIHLSVSEYLQMRAQLKIDSLLSEASPSDVIPLHGTVLAMHLINYGRNWSRFREHVQQLYGEGISCLEVHCEAVVSIFYHLHVCVTVLL